MTGGISQRDLTLEQALQQQNQTASASARASSALQQVETIFTQTTTATSGTPSGAHQRHRAGYVELLRFAFFP